MATKNKREENSRWGKIINALQLLHSAGWSLVNPPPPPPPPPPSLCSTERATDPLGGQINSPVRAAQSAAVPGCSTETISPATSARIAHTAQRFHTTTETHHLHSLAEYVLPVQSTRNASFFSLSIFCSTQPHPPTSFWSGLLTFFCSV